MLVAAVALLGGPGTVGRSAAAAVPVPECEEIGAALGGFGLGESAGVGWHAAASLLP